MLEYGLYVDARVLNKPGDTAAVQALKLLPQDTLCRVYSDHRFEKDHKSILQVCFIFA